MVGFTDLIRGEQQQCLSDVTGDFIVKRKDGLFAYQLAVVLDDSFQGITHVIRGVDLLPSSFRQIFLYNQLGLTIPDHGHVPIIVNSAGDKLSKQTKADALDLRSPQYCLISALRALGQKPPSDLVNYPVIEILNWATEHWSRTRVGQDSLVVDTVFPLDR
jgi:glutamyl-Q tRNA(Asp) synthetase